MTKKSSTEPQKDTELNAEKLSDEQENVNEFWKQVERQLQKVAEIIEQKSLETTDILQTSTQNMSHLQAIVNSLVEGLTTQQIPDIYQQLKNVQNQDVEVLERLRGFETTQQTQQDKIDRLNSQLSPDMVRTMVAAELQSQTDVIIQTADSLTQQLKDVSQYHLTQVTDLQALISTYEPGGLVVLKQKCDALEAENKDLQLKLQTEIKNYHQDKIQDLQDMIDIYEPGGLAVLKQQCDTLHEQNRSLTEQKKELLKKLEVLEIREREQSLITVSPEDLKQAQQDLAEKSKAIKERVVLQSEVERLTKTAGELENELKHLRGIQRANQDDSDARQDVVILREKNEKLEQENDKLSTENSKKTQKIDRQKRNIAEIQRQLDNLKDFEEQYVEYQADLQQTEKLLSAKEKEVRELKRNKQTLEETESRQNREAVEKDTKILELKDENRTLQQDDEQRQSAWELKMRAEFEVERKKWFADKQASLEKKFELKYDLLLTEKDELSGQVAKLTTALAEIKNKYDELQISLSNYDLTDQMLKEARSKISEQSTYWEQHFQQEYQRWIDTASEEYKAELEDVDARVQEQQQKEDAWVESRDERVQEIAGLEGARGALSKEIELLEQKRLGLAEKLVPPEEAKAGLLKGFSENDTFGERPQYSGTETEWLSMVGTGITSSGFVFHSRLLNAFHTALKISDYSSLVVLAGISGTGKSELPRLYADVGGLPFFEIAVQPSWDSTQDLFGFFNYTDGRYKAEPLSRLLYDMTTNPESIYNQHPVLWLLDEMNLARVEYYFADLLSKLETRRGVVNSNNPEQWQRAAVDLDMGPNMPVTLRLPSQLMFVGTMNEDESTLALSDKVLDRSSLLQFPRPKYMKWHQQVKRQRATHRLTWDTWESWKKEPTDAGYTDKLNEMNAIMDKLGRPFGHRLFRNVQAYIANYPLEESEKAFEDQFVMKIAPRLRGLETTQPVVKEQLKRLQQLAPDSLHPAFEEALDQEFFQWSNPSSLFE